MASHISVPELQTVLLAVKQFILSLFQQVDDRVAALEQTVEDNEKVTAAALNQLNERLASLEQAVVDNEKVVAQAMTETK